MPTQLEGLLKGWEKGSIPPCWDRLPHLIPRDLAAAWCQAASVAGVSPRPGLPGWLVLQLVLLRRASLSPEAFSFRASALCGAELPRRAAWGLALPWLCSQGSASPPTSGQRVGAPALGFN